MEDQQPQMSLDLSKTTPILTAAGGKIWHQGYLLRKVSKFITVTFCKSFNILGSFLAKFFSILNFSI